MIDPQLIEAAIEPLETARSLPFQVYVDPDVFQAEVEHIFAKQWVFVCTEGEVPESGDYFATHIAGEPIIVMRGDDGVLRAFSNVCRHRGTILLDDGPGRVDKYITCPYHAWAYEKDGALNAIPFNKVIPVDRSDHQLTQFQLSVWNSLVFVNLSGDATSLEDRLAGIDKYLRLFEPQSFDKTDSDEVETWQANWKLVVENAMESYHLFRVHPTTLEKYTPTRGAYYIAGSSEWSLTGGSSRRQKGFVENLLGSGGNELYEHYVLVSVPPSFVGVLHYGSFDWLSVHPVDVSSTQIRAGSVSTSTPDAQSREFTKAFFNEDKQICERVQRGMHSKSGKGGKLVDMERVIVDFHQFWGTRLGGKNRTSLFEDEAAATWLDAGQ